MDTGIKKLPNGAWKVQARIWVDGKIVQLQRTERCTKEEAKALRQELINQIRGGSKGKNVATYKIRTFGHILDKYEKYSQVEKKFSKGHQYNVDRLREKFGSFESLQFPERFEHFVFGLRKDGKNHQANRYIEVARAAFNVCIGLELLNKNPITKKKFPYSEETPRDKMLSIDEQEKVIAAANANPRCRHLVPFLRFIMQVPCRKSEVIAARIRDYDEINQCIRIYNGTTKNDQGTWKPIPPDMIEWFRDRKKEAQSLEEPIFCRIIKGSRKDRGSARIVKPLGDIKTAWATIRKAAGVPWLRIHDTRHIAATEMVDNGTPEEVVNQVAGWKTNMLRTYYHRNPKRALERVRFAREKAG